MLADLARMADTAIDAVATESLAVVNATLAVPGPVDAGVVRSAPALGWRNIDAGALLRGFTQHLDLPIAVDNEANLAALGELYASDNSLDSFVYVSGGLDIGAGIVLDGQFMRGARGWSGELGHVTVHPDGKPCPCGSRGCLHTYASLEAILSGDPVPNGMSPDAAVAARADAERPVTLVALATAGTALGIALSDMLNVLDMDTVLLGGSFSILSSWLTADVKTEIDQRVLTAAWAPVTVRPALLGPDAAAIGAALTSIDQIRQHPVAWLSQRPERLGPAGSRRPTAGLRTPPRGERDRARHRTK